MEFCNEGCLLDFWNELRSGPFPEQHVNYGPIIFEHIITEMITEKHTQVMVRGAGGIHERREKANRESTGPDLPDEMSEEEKAKAVAAQQSLVLEKMKSIYGKETLNKQEALGVLSALGCAPTVAQIAAMNKDSFTEDDMKNLVKETSDPNDTAAKFSATLQGMAGPDRELPNIPLSRLEAYMRLGNESLSEDEFKRFCAKAGLTDPISAQKLAELLAVE